MRSTFSILLPAGLLIGLVACGDSGSDSGGAGADGTGAENAGGATSNSNSASSSGGSSGSTSTSTSSSAGGSTGIGGNMPLPEHATFHLNYTQDFDLSKCIERDFVVYDLLDTSAADIQACSSLGATMLCYFSSQYEEWRDDANDFGVLAEPLDGWPGERWVDPNDPANLAVMMARLDIAVQKGCAGIDLDNIDRDGHEDYVLAIFGAARSRGLLVSQKNAIEKIGLFYDAVDLYQNEECQEYDECDAYASVKRPVYNIEYSPCKTYDYLYSHRKDIEAMDAWEGPCGR